MNPAERILEATGVDLTATLERLDRWGLAEEGGRAVEAWLAATGAPALHASALGAAPPETAWRFVRLLAFSRPVAAILKQNPEFASLMLEGTDEPEAEDLCAAIIAEGRLLLAAAISPSHRLDRLRWLRQKWALLLAGGEAPEVWRRESDVADALIILARDVAWADLTPKPERDCPVLLVGFGKLGGRELNRSSDIDLVYVLPDGLDEAATKAAFRWAEIFGRAMEAPMGRGSLYRVDLRLRPFGRSGEVARSIKGVESYYRNYAEAWEVQALLRSRPIAGPSELADRWNAMRETTLRRTIWSPERVAELVEQRERTERSADPNDLKRATGGIRDIEWIAQIGTLIGYEGEGPETTDRMLTGLAIRGSLSTNEAATLSLDYRTLRNAEDALQLRDGRQTHLWPDDEGERRALSMMLDGAEESAQSHLTEARERVSQSYEAHLGGGLVVTPLPDLVIGPEFETFLARFHGADDYRRAFRENEGSSARLARAFAVAPKLLHELRDGEILDELISGEIAEERQEIPESGAAAFRRAHARLWLRYALTERGPSVKLPLAILRHAFAGSGLYVFLLGSIATETHGPGSDFDLLLLHPDDLSPSVAEDSARRALDILRGLQREGAPASFDLRLRPDGGKGNLVRSLRSFARYAEEEIAPWERLALGNAREVFGTMGTRARANLWNSVRALLQTVASRPMTPEDRQELFQIKDRVERERSAGEDDLKLGSGGLMDAEWCVRLDEIARGVFESGDLTPRAEGVGLRKEVARIVAARRRADLGAEESEIDLLRQARARIRTRFLELRG